MSDISCLTTVLGPVYNDKQLLHLLTSSATANNRLWIQVERQQLAATQRLWPEMILGICVQDGTGRLVCIPRYCIPILSHMFRELLMNNAHNNGAWHPLSYQPQSYVTDQPHSVTTPHPAEVSSQVLSTAHQHQVGPKGLCVIIANFTSELTGVDVDVKAIDTIFTSRGYNVIGSTDNSKLHDLSASELREKLQNLVDDINSYETSNYDRLAVFVITSHGRVSHPSQSSFVKERADYENISPNEILSILGQTACLLNAPKMLVMANCKSAETSHEASKDWVAYTPPKERVEPARNTIIYETIDLAHLSFMVPDKGSWLLQTLLKTLRQSQQQLQVRELFCSLTRQIMESFHANQNSQASGYSLPSWTSTLSSRFFL